MKPTEVLVRCRLLALLGAVFFLCSPVITAQEQSHIFALSCDWKFTQNHDQPNLVGTGGTSIYVINEDAQTISYPNGKPWNERFPLVEHVVSRDRIYFKYSGPDELGNTETQTFEVDRLSGAHKGTEMYWYGGGQYPPRVAAWEGVCKSLPSSPKPAT